MLVRINSLWSRTNGSAPVITFRGLPVCGAGLTVALTTLPFKLLALWRYF